MRMRLTVTSAIYNFVHIFVKNVPFPDILGGHHSFGGYQFLAAVYFSRSYLSHWKKKRRKEAPVVAVFQVDTVTVLTLARLVPEAADCHRAGLAAVTLTSFQHKTQHQPSSFLSLSRCSVGLSSLAPPSHGWTFLFLSFSFIGIFIHP